MGNVTVSETIFWGGGACFALLPNFYYILIMGRQFNVPNFYKSTVISALKKARREGDQRKKDLTPTIVECGEVTFKLARHFGFCFGVENAIEIAYRALEENKDRRVFLLSEIIHNPHVNGDLSSRGIKFIMSPEGKQLVPFEDINSEDVVIIPAFGTSPELLLKLQERGVDPATYNATCPFVEKVWKKAKQIGDKSYTIIVHGKHTHEETRATFSHARESAPTLIIRDMAEATILSEFILGDRTLSDFYSVFTGRFSDGFDAARDLVRIGVVNQTTMLASETEAIANLLKSSMIGRYGELNVGEHFADTRDTLCYATLDNQTAVYGLIESGGDLAIVVGGYTSSNTSHLVEILQEKLPCFFVKDSDEIMSLKLIRHLDIHTNKVIETSDWMPNKRPITVLITAGASCPDALVQAVMERVAELVTGEFGKVAQELTL